MTDEKCKCMCKCMCSVSVGVGLVVGEIIMLPTSILKPTRDSVRKEKGKEKSGEWE